MEVNIESETCKTLFNIVYTIFLKNCNNKKSVKTGKRSTIKLHTCKSAPYTCFTVLANFANVDSNTNIQCGYILPKAVLMVFQQRLLNVHKVNKCS